MQPGHPVAERLEHPLHLPVAPLVERELDPAAAEPAGPRQGGEPVVQLDAPGEAAQHVVGRLGLELDLVDLLDAVAGMREAVREGPVVREQERAGRVRVEAADRNDTRLGRDELDDRGSPLRVARGGDDARRLVEEQMRELLLHDLAAVDLDAVGRLHERVELPRLAVDQHAARLDQVVGLAARGDSGPGEKRVEAHE